LYALHENRFEFYPDPRNFLILRREAMAYAFRNILCRFVLVVGVLALLTTMVWAQAGTGELTGLVADPSGAVVPNAQVTLANSATGDKRTTVTTPAGVYRFSALPIVGNYTLEIAPKGFKAVKIANLVMSVGTTVTQDVKLELGTGSEQVTVEAGAEVVQTSEAALSQLVDRRIWQQMPLQVRNQNSFIELVAGAVPQDGTNNNRGAEVNGTRGGAGSYLVDGTDNNEQGQAGRGQISGYDKGGASTSISPDAIQEYRVITNGYSAEYGKGGGFITDTVLRSGTNSWHGSAFEYNRIQKLTANDWFSNLSEQTDHLVRNQFGGSLGGPIVKDKTFWFGSGELHRVRQSVPVQATATTSEFLNFVQSGGLQQWAETDPNGLCVQDTGAPCPGAFPLSGTLGPIFSALSSNPAMNYKTVSGISCATSPAACLGRGLYTAGLTYPVPVYGTLTVSEPTSQNEARWSLKFDHRLGQNDQFSGLYLFQDSTNTTKFFNGFNTIGPDSIQDGRGQNVALSWTHTFSPTVLNTFKASYLRHRLDFPAPKGAFGAPAYYTLDGIGVDLGLSPGLPQFFTENQFQYLDNISIVHGKHSVKTGGEYRRIRNGSRFFNDAFQTILPWSIEDTVTDLAFDDEADLPVLGYHYYGGAYYVSASVDPTTGQAPNFYRGFRANEMAGFVQDDWRVSNRLTLNLGLRWEYFGPPHNFQPGIDSNFYFGANVAPIKCTDPNTAVTAPCNLVQNAFFPANDRFYAGVATGNFQVRDHELWNKDTNNFAPRVGFAWDVLGTQKLVVRASGGIMYDRLFNNVFENIRFNPPFFSDNQIGTFKNGVPVGAVSTPGLVTFPFTSRGQYASGGLAPLPNPRHMNQNIVTAYYEQAHFGFQWEFAKGFVLEPEYVGTFGHKLTGVSDINTFDGRVALGTNCVDVTGLGSSDVGCRINHSFGADNFRSNGYDSNYHALQVSLKKTYSSGLSFNGNYTYSKALDTVSDLFNNGNALSGLGRPTDQANHKLDYGPADFDTRHRGVVTVTYDLPFLKANRWLGGWGVNSIIAVQTGHPWTPFGGNSSAADLNKDGIRNDRIVPTTGNIDSTFLHGSAVARSDPANGIGPLALDASLWGKDPVTGVVTYFQCPASVNGGLWCNPPIRRNSIFGPGGANVDFNVTKTFKVNERAGVTFQANFFDLFNHPNFLNPTTGNSGSSNIRNGDFSASRATWGDNGGHRVTQLALRFDF
jgi:Carboxypeptidase regulatory-like domain